MQATATGGSIPRRLPRGVGPPKLFTKDVLETALNEQLTEHLGHKKNKPGEFARRRGG